MAIRTTAVLLLMALILGCRDDKNDSDTGGEDSSGDSESTEVDDTSPDASIPDEVDTVDPGIIAKVYAHSATTLYQVDPDTLALSEVGPFAWPEGLEDEQMTDIAIDADRNMIGVSYGRVFSVDKATAECTYLADLSGNFNGLSFVEGDETTLVGATLAGEWFTLDMETGASTLIGTYGDEMASSGDIVYIRDAGAYATVKHPDYDTNLLVMVEPSTGEAAIIGETGFIEIWGVGYWGGQIFGFTKSGEFILIDAETGAGELVETLDASFWGAGVTTIAPILV